MVLVPQPVNVPLTRSALFLVATVNPGADAREGAFPVRRPRFTRPCRGISGRGAQPVMRHGNRKRRVGPALRSTSTDRIAPVPRDPRSGRHAIATPGDLLFHIRAQHFDLCFELGTQIVERLGGAISVVDEVHGFRYFDARDLLGFVDGTENPVGQVASDATLIGEEDAAFGGGSYVIVQKYLHDLASWNALRTEEQERIIGRAKLSDIETDDAKKAPYAHNVLTTIEKDGKEIKILRDNMPFGRAGGEFGTYFIGYSRSPATIEQMLDNMFIGKPPGNYDRLLDFSRPVTGSLFFVPSATFLENVADQESPAATVPE